MAAWRDHHGFDRHSGFFRAGQQTDDRDVKRRRVIDQQLSGGRVDFQLKAQSQVLAPLALYGAGR